VAVERWVWDQAGGTFSAEAAKAFALKSGRWHAR